MRPYVRLGAALTATALATAVSVLAFAPAAHAATLTVTTADDVVNAADGVMSLREAVSEANAAGESTTIVLAAATTYELDLCGAAEDANASGDLDHVADQDLTIEGNGATIEQTCAGERILHTTSATATVTLTALTLTGGTGDGAAVSYAGDLVVSGSTVAGNTSAVGGVLASDSAMSGPSLNLIDSTVGPNTGRGIGGSFGTTVTITGSTITLNTGEGVDLTDGHLDVAGSTVTDNGDDGLRTTGQGSGLFTVVDSEVSGNGGTGIVCSNCGDLQVTGSLVAGNEGGGIAVLVDQDEPTDDLTVTVATSDVLDNTRDGPGAGLRVEITELSDDAPLAQIVIDASTFAGNESTGALGTGGGIDADTGEVRVTNSTIVENTASVSGGGISSADGIFLQHATVVANAAPAGSQLSTDASLDTFGSIVADGAGGGECVLGAGTVSAGYNVGGDGTCGFTGPGDQNTAGAANLGPLQDNGGPTLTRLPLATSPALGAVPASACTVSTVDQRGVARPAGAACEAGAVEVDDGELATTGTSLTGLILGGGVLVLIGGLILALLAIRRRPAR